MKHLLVLLSAFTLTLTASAASAQTDSDTYPARFTQRPITLPAMTLKADLAFHAVHQPDPIDSLFALNLGAAFGIIDDLEVGISGDRQGLTNLPGNGLVPLLVSPDFEFRDIYLYGRYRFVNTESFEMGVELGLNIPTNTDFGIFVAVPFRARFSEAFSLDGGLELVTFFSDPDTSVALRATVQPRIAPVDFLYFGLDFGVGFGFTDPNIINVALGLEAGYVIDLDSVKIDAFLNFSFPGLHYSADFGPAGRQGDTVTEVWLLTLGARAFIGLGG